MELNKLNPKKITIYQSHWHQFPGFLNKNPIDYNHVIIPEDMIKRINRVRRCM